MEPLQYCICGAGVLTRIIGWIQAVGSMLFVMYLTTVIQPMVQNMSNNTDKEVAKPRTIYAFTLLYFLILLLSSMVGFVMAVVLLKGSYLRNPQLLQAFIVYIIISYYVSFVFSVTELIIDSESNVWATLLVLILSGLVQGFFLITVRAHKEEIEREIAGLQSQAIKSV